eukprot:m.312779 g.312779  ORF g.312779 m.312779 type:complete len:212 (-) comp27470_c1_seq2:1940-2575(-)
MSWASPPKASPSVLRRRLQDDDSSSGAERVLAPPPHSATAIGHAPRERRSDGGLEDEGVASDGAEGSRGNGSRGAARAGISGGLRARVYGAGLLAARKPVLLCLVFAIGLGTVFNDKASTLLSKVHETPFWTRAGSAILACLGVLVLAGRQLLPVLSTYPKIVAGAVLMPVCLTCGMMCLLDTDFVFGGDTSAIPEDLFGWFTSKLGSASQ